MLMRGEAFVHFAFHFDYFGIRVDFGFDFGFAACVWASKERFVLLSPPEATAC